MSEPLAYLISFRTHGTWLHGDNRGSVDPNTNHTPHFYDHPALLSVIHYVTNLQ